MNWQFLHNAADKILVLKTDGVLDLSSANRMRTEGIELIRKNNYQCCLIDHSQAEGIKLSTLEIYDLPKRYKELNVPYGFRLAVVVPDVMRVDLNFYETVCRNNGYLVSIFFDKESAIKWLKS
ncbi:MAG: hypothetical protein U0V02_15825 [Anaerolineales bacterium]